MTDKQQPFEKAFERLEEILKLLNDGQISLDESLKLFEEADSLINNCSLKLTSAEQKIETLIKNRSNELVLDKDEKPKKEPFSYINQEDDELPSFR
jgi:exodeoxyribonuclease VII small subunit